MDQPQRHSKGDILIVDDTLPNLRLLSTMLTEHGYEVRGVPNGTMALLAVRSVPPDLVLLDINMPKLDGYEVCQQLKADPATQDIPVIFISALDEVLDKVRAFSVGGVDYITKPFQIAEILVRVETHLTLRRLQCKLQQANQALSQTNAELAAANVELRAANAALKASHQELDAFARTVAQDLKHPLALITNYADQLKEHLSRGEEPTEACRELLNRIEQDGRHSARVIDALLLLAWVRKGDVEAGPVDMGGVVERVRRSLAWLIEQRQATFSVPSTWPAALGYEPWLEEVWSHYLSNALEHSGQPPRIELGASLEPDGMARFWVRDNGPGLASDLQATLFTEFTELEPVTQPGRGLGLAIVRRIIEKLGGRVGVEGAGHGNCFYFTLPAP